MEDHGKACGPLIENGWDEVTHPKPPSIMDMDYKVTIILDSSISGWGGYFRLNDNGEQYEVKAGWRKGYNGSTDFSTGFSARAEPTGILEGIRFLLEKGFVSKGDKVAVVTDHEAIVNRQEKWFSRTGGFSSAFHLNEVYRVPRESGLECIFFYVQGECNIADVPSHHK